MRNSFFTLSVFAVLILLGALLENLGSFTLAKNILRNRDLPSPLLNFGKRGQIFREMGLRYVAPLDDTEREKRGWRRVSLDLTKMNIKDEWSRTGEVPAENLPSSKIIGTDMISTGMPLISMYIDENDLYNERTGIYANPLERGRNWERPCFISYFDKGELLFGSAAGVRIHGGTSRKHDVKNFRFYFRTVYGAESFGSNILFEGRGDPLEHIIIKKADTLHGFSNSIAYDIARKTGCIAPYTKPVRFYINGKPNGSGYAEIIEHLSREYLDAHLGHRDFIYYKVKGTKKVPREYRDLYEWARFSPEEINFRSVSGRIDIENFTSFWVFNIFIGNTDPYQGIALFNRRERDAKWFWLTWDVDHCLVNVYENDKQYIWQKERPVSLLYTNRKKETDPRYFIFRKLMFGDEEYRNFFRRRFTEAVNYKLDRDFLFSVADHYSGISDSFGMGLKDSKSILRDFMTNRPLYAMELLDRYFGLGRVCRVEFRIPKGRILDIDGFAVNSSFTAYYFSGYGITVRGRSDTVKFWIVNGVKTPGAELRCGITGASVIEPVF